MSKTQLYIGTDLLDFDEHINVVRRVMDFRDLDIGSNVKSYTLDIGLTKNNRKFLKFPANVKSRVEVEDEARLLTDDIEVIRGKFKTMSIGDQKIRAIVDANDWLEDISGVSIKDLGWVSGDNHVFGPTTVVDSWTAGAGAFYRYPLIFFSRLWSQESSPSPAVYPYDFYPAWSIPGIIEKIFTNKGYTVAAGGFFDSATAQALYIESAPHPNDDDFI